MSKRLYLFFALLLLATPLLALAQGAPCTPGGASGALCNGLAGIGVTDVEDFIEYLFTWLATVIGTLALVMVIASGAQMIFSQGNAQAVSKAKSAMSYAIIGFVVILLGYVIVSAVQYFIGVQNNPGGGGTFQNPLRDANLLDFVLNTMRDFLGIIGAIAILYIVIAGFRYVMAGPNEEAATKARGTMTWAVIGLASVILSYVIVTVVLNTLRDAATP